VGKLDLIDLGSGILGYLDKAQSLTDQDGYAWNVYYALRVVPRILQAPGFGGGGFMSLWQVA